MHTTTVKMKDGRTLAAPMNRFRPVYGYITLLGAEEKFPFADMISCVTEADRRGRTCCGDTDEIERAREYMRYARKFGWDGVTADTPLQIWEVEDNTDGKD